MASRFFLEQGGEEDVEMAAGKPPHYLRGGLECCSCDGSGFGRNQHYMYCRQRLMMLRTNAATAIMSVVHARNSACLKCLWSFRA